METTLTNEFMQRMLATTKDYCVMILRQGPKSSQPGADKIVWEHGRRNFQLRAEGVLSIVCPVVDDSVIKGICIFDANVDETRRIMAEDSSVRAGIFVYETHLCRGFPGGSLAR